MAYEVPGYQDDGDPMDIHEDMMSVEERIDEYAALIGRLRKGLMAQGIKEEENIVSLIQTFFESDLRG